jgi:putative Holliday junction resolvase
MPRILSIDYGTKRTGLAVTDPLQIIASGLDTVNTSELFDYLDGYFQEEEVEGVVVGEPFYPDGKPAQLSETINEFVQKLEKKYPDLKVFREDERYSSEEAKQIIRDSGAKKKKRQDKGLVDKVSAIIILEQFMRRSGKWE